MSQARFSVSAAILSCALAAPPNCAAGLQPTDAPSNGRAMPFIPTLNVEVKQAEPAPLRSGAQPTNESPKSIVEIERELSDRLLPESPATALQELAVESRAVRFVLEHLESGDTNAIVTQFALAGDGTWKSDCFVDEASRTCCIGIAVVPGSPPQLATLEQDYPQYLAFSKERKGDDEAHLVEIYPYEFARGVDYWRLRVSASVEETFEKPFGLQVSGSTTSVHDLELIRTQVGQLEVTRGYDLNSEPPLLQSYTAKVQLAEDRTLVVSLICRGRLLPRDPDPDLCAEVRRHVENDLAFLRSGDRP